MPRVLLHDDKSYDQVTGSWFYKDGTFTWDGSTMFNMSAREVSALAEYMIEKKIARIGFLKDDNFQERGE